MKKEVKTTYNLKQSEQIQKRLHAFSALCCSRRHILFVLLTPLSDQLLKQIVSQASYGFSRICINHQIGHPTKLQRSRQLSSGAIYHVSQMQRDGNRLLQRKFWVSQNEHLASKNNHLFADSTSTRRANNDNPT